MLKIQIVLLGCHVESTTVHQFFNWGFDGMNCCYNASSTHEPEKTIVFNFGQPPIAVKTEAPTIAGNSDMSPSKATRTLPQCTGALYIIFSYFVLCFST